MIKVKKVYMFFFHWKASNYFSPTQLPHKNLKPNTSAEKETNS